jgi:glutamine synthetase
MSMLEITELDARITAGEIDTVLVVFPDLTGRLLGKRVTGHFFRDEVLGSGVEACNYLLAVDIEMEPLPGYRFASWDQGYGDVTLAPDLSTLRLLPWLEKTALVLCDLVDEDGAPIEVSPRRILQRQLARAEAAGFSIKCGSELEFYLFKESYDDAAAKRWADLTPHSTFNEDYHVFQTSRDEYLIRQIRNAMDGAGVPVEFSKGEAGRGQHEINLRYAGALEMADRHVIYKNGAKEIAALNDRSLTFMAKYSMDESGSSCHVHSSLWSREGDQPLVWGRDNRTCGLRLVGHGPSFRVESRIPGADCNPYLAFAATIAAGLHGIEHRLDPGPEFTGNAYEADGVTRVPGTLVDAIGELERSAIAAEVFGDDVHHHLLNTARQEWARSNAVVTDWERMRTFEQI